MTLKMAAFAPMPIASDNTATAVKALLFVNPRHTWRTSTPMPLNHCPMTGIRRRGSGPRWEESARTSQVANGVPTHPSSRRVVGRGQPPRHGQRRGIQFLVSRPDAAKGPADAFLHQVAVVGSALLNEAEAGDELRVGRGLVVTGQAGEQRKPGPLLELTALFRPLGHAAPRMRRLIKQLEADGVADAPV